MSRIPGTSRSPAAHGLAAWLGVWLVCAPPYLPAVLAAPEGEQVVHGEATFERDGNLTVIRPSDGAIIQYQGGFDILRNETVQFIQPSEQSRVLNRVYGDATRIDGSLLANGIVYIVNPAGVFYGGEAIVNVRDLVTIGGTLGNEDFLNGVDRFDLSAPVENHGTIQAQSVSLLGTRVANYGAILAPDGVIALVAGERVVLAQLEGGIHVVVDGPGEMTGPEPGIVQAGTLDAGSGGVQFAVGDHYSLALNHQGMTRAREIEVRAGAEGVVQVSGTLDASSHEAGEQGGEIRVMGDRVALLGATLDASGDAGGGAIRVGGELRGQGPLPNARRVLVDATSVLVADAISSGDGGSAVLFSEEATGFAGQISARGGAESGDGGFIELSSNGLLIDQGAVDLRAPAGDSGTLLYDPQDIVIQGGTDDGTDSPDLSVDLLSANAVGEVDFGDTGTGATPFVVWESELEGTNANIVLEARNSITAAGNFNHIQDGEGAGVVLIQSGNDLTMQTANGPTDANGATAAPGINLTTSVDHGANLEFRTSGDGRMRFNTGTAESDGADAPIRLGRLRTEGSEVLVSTEDGLIEATSIVASGLDATGLDGNVDGANGGPITLSAGDKNINGDTHIVVTGDLTARGGNGTTGEGGNGGRVLVVTRATAVPPPVPPPPAGTPPPLPVGGGPITVQNVDTTGGNGPVDGGNGGQVLMQSFADGDVSTGNITTLGGNAIDLVAASQGGNGGIVDIQTADGDISVGAINTSGGDSDATQNDPMADEDLGGVASSVNLNAGTAANPDASGSILLRGQIVARGGAGGAPSVEAPVRPADFGGRVTLDAREAIAHDGDAGAHILTSNDVDLSASEIGAANPLRIDASGDVDAAGIPEPNSTLTVTSDGDANVDVTQLGFATILINTRSADSDIDVTQTGDVVRVDGDTIQAIDTTSENTDVRITLEDELDRTVSTGSIPANDIDLDLVVPTGSTRVGGVLELVSEDDIVIGTGAGVAIEAHFDPGTVDETDPDAEGMDAAARIVLFAGNEPAGEMGVLTGAIRSGGGSIDRSADGSPPGVLILDAAQGIGTAANPILMQSGGKTAAANRQTGGIFLRNTTDGELVIGAVPLAGGGTFAGVRNFQGSRPGEGAGDIVVENTGGALTLESFVLAPGDIDENGGAVRLAATGPITLNFSSNITPVADANGNLELDGDVEVAHDATLVSREGDVAILGTIDTSALANPPPPPMSPTPETRLTALTLTARLENEADDVEMGTVRIDGDVGVAMDMRNLTVNGDLALTGDEDIELTNNLLVTGDIYARGVDDSASLAILAGPSVEFGGNIGARAEGEPAGSRLSGFSVTRNTTPPASTLPTSLPDPTVAFTSDEAQSVVTGAGGIAISPTGLMEVPETASIWKNSGDLTLTSAGTVNLGENVKLTVPGTINMAGSTVIFGDVNTPELHVNSPDTRVRARAPGSVQLKSGGHINDVGTDIITNVFDLSSAPTIVGTGNTPQVASGSVNNAGPLLVTGFSNRIGSNRLFRGETALDLTILPPDPGLETPQLGPPIVPLVPPRPGRESASGSALAPSAEEVLAWLRCGAERRDDCPAAPSGSPLDSPRGAELEQLAYALLGTSAEADAARSELSHLDPEALRQLAVLLTEVRLLGLDESEYATVRDALFEQLRSEAGAQAPDPSELAQGVRSQSRGVPL